MKRIIEAREVWDKLSNIPVDNDGNIELEFMDFDIGTDREYIWHWIEDKYKVSVAIDLMRDN